ncbi:hypothetical protein ONR73_14640 [Aeromonas veronii]|uniref:hypothetical protein n=1 Tax=Aeromonas veronii TaxID=654 RepID=UPI00222EA3EF|nr:hypothetical protein [Aeromonas veronii]UZE58152.1 hypothetical protein ONR73_14640 [Aeromonas veronii]
MTDLEDLSTYCKKICGLDVGEVAKKSNVPRRTLYDWWKNRRKTVELIVKGIAIEQDDAIYARNELKVEWISRIVSSSSQSREAPKEGDMKQYFERLELEGDYIWAVFEAEDGLRKEPLEIRCVSFTQSSIPEEVVLQQDSGGWWYSRQKYNADDAKAYADEIMMMMNKLEQRKRAF